MKMKRFVLILGIVIIVLVGVVVLVNSFRGNDDDVVMSDIRDNYEDIEEDISSYNEARNRLISVTDNYYSSNLEKDYDKFVDCLGDEEELLDSIYEEVLDLDKLCLDRLFRDKDVNKICSDYKVYYETVFNVFVNDVNKFNVFVDDYNGQYGKSLVKYSSSLGGEYIDYNGDGIYLESEDSDE